MAFRHEPRQLNGSSPVAPVRAATYVRMSTDHQRYSIANQAAALQRYATQHNMVVVRTYADEGKSGLGIDGRAALQRLINDVQSDNAPFEAVLVYDISRWGRFQDADESAYYEYICRRSGIRVIYCAEQLANDGSLSDSVMKSLKRVMAGEYSRELSTKVFAGQCRLIKLGYRQGGPAGFGLRRLLIDESGSTKGELQRGEHKSLQTDRVVLTPGPQEEVTTVQRIYRLFVEDKMKEREIAELLNLEGYLTDQRRPWTRGTIHQVLTNEKYIGCNVFNRTSGKLKSKRVRNPPEQWIRQEHAFKAVIDEDLFTRANAIISSRSCQFTDQEMLDLLSQLFKRQGSLSGLIIDEQESFPSSSAFRSRFGSLLRAYSLIGYQPDRDYRYIVINRELRRRLPQVIKDVESSFRESGALVRRSPDTDFLLINDEFSVSVVICRCFSTPGGSHRWRVRFDTGLAPDITVAVRMRPDNQAPLDFYLFPHIDIPLEPVRLAEENWLSLDAYRFDTLEALYDLGARTQLRRSA